MARSSSRTQIRNSRGGVSADGVTAPGICFTALKALLQEFDAEALRVLQVAHVADVAKLLRPFDIRPRTVRFGHATAKGYTRDRFTEAFERYLGDPGAHQTEAQAEPEAPQAANQPAP